MRISLELDDSRFDDMQPTEAKAMVADMISNRLWNITDPYITNLKVMCSAQTDAYAAQCEALRLISSEMNRVNETFRPRRA